MTRTKKSILIMFAVATALVTAIVFWAQQQCEETSATFQENFSSTDYKDHTASAIGNWPSGPIRLSRLGANFAVAEQGGMGARIYVCDAGDFDGDGYPDLIGLDITHQADGHATNQSQLKLIRNIYPQTPGEGQIFQVDHSKVFDTFDSHTAPASIVVADFNGDGLTDFFFMRNSQDSLTSYENFSAVMYIQVDNGVPDDPVFHPRNQAPNLDFTAAFQAAGIYHSWAADHVAAVDIDGDGDMDLLVISKDQIFLVRNPGRPDFALENFEIAELNYDQRTGFLSTGAQGSRGGSSVAAADFRNSGHIDVVGGTVNDQPFLVYYQNDGHGYFTREEIAIPDPTCTRVVATMAADFTNNGWPDIFAATDGIEAGTNNAKMWFLRNHGLKEIEVESVVIDPETGETITITETVSEIDWEFICLNNCAPIIPPEYDVVMSAVLDYDQDGDMDVILADANHSSDYYLVINELADAYALTGIAQSTVVSEPVLNPAEHSITKARLTQLHMGARGGLSEGLKVEIWLSNNGGRKWELYWEFSGAELQNYAHLPWHEFHHFGARLKWKARLFADEDEIFDDFGAAITGASNNTPTVGLIQIEYVYVDRREYSRASAAATITTSGGESKRLIIASSFIFPGFNGQLRAYDVTQIPLSGGSGSSLRTVTSSDLGSETGRTLEEGVEIFWDAGLLLRDRSPAGRTVYTAVRQGGHLANPLVRTDFTAANAGTLEAFLKDFNNDNAGLIDFIRGEGRDWKLGDINHSTPVVVGAPSEDPLYMGDGYEAFVKAQRDRTKVIYVGANDGMLHCFNVQTGEELWGFVPYNLLSSLRNMWVVDSATGERYLGHDVFVDGTPSIADVRINGEWKTVLVCGQGPGSGGAYAGPSGKVEPKNYYFALDITEPENPIPLWEFTHMFSSQQQYYPSVGETWSIPAIGKIKYSGVDRWAAFMGSGYNNTDSTAGNRFYVVAVDTGELLWQASVGTGVDTNDKKHPAPYSDILPVIPGSPAAFDANNNGYVDYVYFGDLDGRLWKLEVNLNNWKMTTIYSDRLNYPIVSKPAVWVNRLSGDGFPRTFFGTGGDDRAPNDRIYSFIALLDGSKTEVEWYMGNPTALGLPEAKSVGTFEAGEKVWADPVVSDFIVYFSTLRGSIESVNPCVDIGGGGRLYARYIQSTAGVPIGGTAFKLSDGSTPESLQLVSKARRAVTVGEVRRDQGLSKREIYIQEYDSTIEMLEHSIGNVIQIKSWREVYKIIK
ncbi:MAG: PilC/PilY family type IV pilus protein [Acidobacteriota bacterium]|nr:PilC/PilY family type IV pilus protein [Acidobacteriota bacterium]